MALTDTDLQVVVEHVKRMLPAMLIETAPRSHLQGDASAAPGNYAEEQTCDEVGEEHGFV